MIDRVVPFERFRAEIEAVVLTPAAEDKKSTNEIIAAVRRGHQVLDSIRWQSGSLDFVGQ